MFNIIAILIFAITGAFIYRWRGMNRHLHPLPQLLLAAPYAIICGWWALLVFPLTFRALLFGPGSYYLPPSRKIIEKPETIDFLLRPFFGRDPRDEDVIGNEPVNSAIAAYGESRLYWRCFAGQAVEGLLITLPAGLCTPNPAIALSGVLKAVAYAVTKGNTERAELLTGFFLWGAFALLF